VSLVRNATKMVRRKTLAEELAELATTTPTQGNASLLNEGRLRSAALSTVVLHAGC
jgi:hypothetical protein